MRLPILRPARAIALLAAGALATLPPARAAAQQADGQPGRPRPRPAVEWLRIPGDPALQRQFATSGPRPDSAATERRWDARLTFAGLQALPWLYALPFTLSLRVADCGALNAAYLRRSGDVVLCDELLRALAPQRDEENMEARAAAISVVTAQEPAHARIDRLAPPRLGREEDAADQFAAWLLFDRL